MADAALTPGDSGPTDAPPSLPPGWIAQWDSSARTYYYVAIATSHSQWEVPIEPAPGVPNMASPAATQPSPYPKPDTPNPDGTNESTPSTASRGVTPSNDGERGLGSTTINTLLGGHSKPGKQPGLSGLAQQFIGGGSHGSSSGGSHGVLGQLAGMVNGNKPQGHGQSSGAGSLFGGMMGTSSHGSSQGTPHSQQQSYGYNGTQQGGNAPPPQYQPPGQNAQPNYSGSGVQHNQHYNIGPPEGSGPNTPFYVGGHPPNYDPTTYSYTDRPNSSSTQSQGYQSSQLSGQPPYTQQSQYPPQQHGGYGNQGYDRPPPPPPAGGYQQGQGHGNYPSAPAGGYYGGQQDYLNHQQNQYTGQPSYPPPPNSQPAYPPPPGEYRPPPGHYPPPPQQSGYGGQQSYQGQSYQGQYPQYGGTGGQQNRR